MLLKFFKGTGPGVILMISLVFAFIWAGPFINTPADHLSLNEVSAMPLYKVLAGILSPGHTAAKFLTLLISSALLFLIVHFNTSIFFINERTFLPALIYILLTGMFPDLREMHPVIPASLFFMIALQRIMDAYHRQGVAYSFFDAGILISTGSLFYANLIWFGVIILLGIILFRTVSLSEISVSLLGLATPYLMTLGLYYVLGYDPGEVISTMSSSLFSEAYEYNYHRLTIVTLIFLGSVLVISTVFLMMMQNSKKIKSRKTFTLLIWILVISAGIFIFSPSASVEMIWIASIPMSYILTHYFIFHRKKIVAEIFFTSLAILVFTIQVISIYEGW